MSRGYFGGINYRSDWVSGKMNNINFGGFVFGGGLLSCLVVYRGKVKEISNIYKKKKHTAS